MPKVFAFTLLSTLSFLFSVPPALAYTNPGNPAGFVNDFAGMLDSASRTALEAKLASFAKKTGHEIAVATILSLDGDTVENFAEKLFQDWGIGKRGADNGVLLLVARDDRRFRIEVGYGLEGTLTDAQSSQILRNILTPAFKAGDYARGIDAATDAIIGATRGEVISNVYVDNRGAITVTRPERPLSLDDWFLLIFAIPMWFGSILGRSKSWWLGGVLGGVAGVVLGFVFGFLYWGVIALAVLVPLGLLFDYIVSHIYARSIAAGHRPPWWIGGGRSGGGGASGSW